MNSAKSLDPLKIRSQLNKGRLSGAEDLVVLGCIDSTNNWALSQCVAAENLPRACFAEQQLQGRGRNNRHWYSPHAQNIYMSLAYQFDIKPAYLYGLSLVAGLSIVRVLKKLGVEAGLKWPNDVYTESGKIAGILVETRIKPDAGICAVIGIGLNYDMGQGPDIQIDAQWTDFLKEYDGNSHLERSLLAGKLLNEIMSGCELFVEAGFENFRDEWNRHDLCAGKTLDIYENDCVVQGRYLGINENGALVAQVNDSEKIFYAADVSIRMKE